MQSRTLAVVVVAGGVLFEGAALRAQTPPIPQTAPNPQTAPAAEGPQTVTAVAPVEPEDTGVSHIRIVRLSQVRGAVQMDRNTGRGYEIAFANIPVVAGARLRTGEGVAEVEFEDNSSLRLAPNTEVRFARLSRTATGATETTVDVVKGLVYVGLEKGKSGEFALTDGKARLDLVPGAHLRLDASQPQGELAMFDGSAQLEVGSAVTTVSKKQTLILNPAADTLSAVQHGTQEGDWDAWDKQENDYHKVKASFAGSGVGGFGMYGVSDLNYYGSFVDMPGCGSMWRPYFASAGWDPFANGVWALYPGAGYSWVSPYPWGWLPFHSGTWASCGGAGWGWRPGGSWYGLSNATALRLSNRSLPHPVPRGPGRAAETLVPVNMKPLAVSGIREQAFQFQRNSAGLGVPRSGFGNLRGLSGSVEHHGMAMTGVPENAIMATPMNMHQPGMAGVRGGEPGRGNQDWRAGAGLSSASAGRAGSVGPGSENGRGGWSGASSSSAGMGGGMRGGAVGGGGAAAAAGASAGGGGHH